MVVAMLASDDVELLPRRLASLVVCALVALEHSSAFETVRYRTYKLSSLIFCAGLVGGQAMAVLWRTLSSVEDLRAATEQLRTNSILSSFVLVAEYLGYPPTTFPPFTIVG